MPLTFDELKKLCKEYNDAQPEGAERVIVEKHSFFCRCTTCWYEYDGEARDKKHGDGGWMSTESLTREVMKEEGYSRRR